jgi:hypothetical protein
MTLVEELRERAWFNDELEARAADEIERLQRALAAMCRGWKNGDLTEAEFVEAWELSRPNRMHSR